MSDFDWAVSLVLRLEGGLSLDPHDPGNWTEGEVGKGELKGTKYGISAAAYPHLDIRSLTKDQAIAIYRQDYWVAMGCPGMSRRLAVLVFDSAVQHGVTKASEWLGAPLEFDTYLGRRLKYYASLSLFDRDGAGWMTRVGNLLLALEERPDRVETMVVNAPFWSRLQMAISGRLDGGVLYRVRPKASGSGGKVDVRSGTE